MDILDLQHRWIPLGQVTYTINEIDSIPEDLIQQIWLRSEKIKNGYGIR